MAKLTATQVTKLAKSQVGRHADGGGLYLVVPTTTSGDPGNPYWMFRYSVGKKRREMTLGKLNDISLAQARALAAQQSALVREGQNPIALKRKATEQEFVTVDDLFEDWQKTNEKRLKHAKIPARVYRKDIQPHIGDIPLDQVTARDIRKIITSINGSGRPTISNDALMYCKQLFNHGIKLDVVGGNPASAFQVSDAGGLEASRDRALTLDEIKHVFKVFRDNPMVFTRDNYLACALLLLLGVRKSELCEAKWEEFDLEKGTWELPKERSKSGVGFVIPLPELAVKMLTELKLRACGSEYVLPSRRLAKQPHMGSDTLNRAIAKMFGKDPGKKKQPANLMGDIEYFRVHDLRRTCRTLLASLGVPGHVAERCLNHKLKGVEGIYDRYDYFEERRGALEKLSLALQPTPFSKEFNRR